MEPLAAAGVYGPDVVFNAWSKPVLRVTAGRGLSLAHNPSTCVSLISALF
jgi:hypothetical protein